MAAPKRQRGFDLRALTTLIADANEDQLGPMLPWSLLDGLAELIPAEEVSICELGGQPLDYPFIGAATMTVLNVAPTDDGVVNVRFEIQWPSVLQWRATFFIE